MIFPFVRRAGLLFVLTIAMATSPARAQEEEDCAQKSSTPEMNACFERALAAADDRLNELFQQALEHIAAAEQLTAEQRKDWEAALRESQRRWMRFRDIDCGEVIGFEWLGGTGMAAASLGCKLTKTEARAAELEERYAGN
jgi:uncharacterized protein YecT (DUF1311 family)